MTPQREKDLTNLVIQRDLNLFFSVCCQLSKSRSDHDVKIRINQLVEPIVGFFVGFFVDVLLGFFVSFLVGFFKLLAMSSS